MVDVIVAAPDEALRHGKHGLAIAGVELAAVGQQVDGQQEEADGQGLRYSLSPFHSTSPHSTNRVMKKLTLVEIVIPHEMSVFLQPLFDGRGDLASSK